MKFIPARNHIFIQFNLEVTVGTNYSSLEIVFRQGLDENNVLPPDNVVDPASLYFGELRTYRIEYIWHLPLKCTLMPHHNKYVKSITLIWDPMVNHDSLLVQVINETKQVPKTMFSYFCYDHQVNLDMNI